MGDNFGRLIKDARQVYMELLELKADLASIDEEVKTLGASKVLLTRRLQDEPAEVQQSRVIQENPARRALTDKRHSLVAELRDLLLVKTEIHPDVVETRRRIRALDEEIAKTPQKVESQTEQVVNPLVTQMKDKILNVEARLHALEARRDERREQIARYSKLWKEQQQLDRKRIEYEREVRRNQDNYDVYKELELAARNTLESAVEQRGYELSVWEHARLPREPDGPRTVLFAVMSLMLGLAVGTGLIFVAELNDASFRTVDDASSYLRVPVVGAIPMIATAEEKRWLAARSRLWALLAAAVAGCVGLLLVGIVFLSIHDPSYFMLLLDDPFEGIGVGVSRILGLFR